MKNVTTIYFSATDNTKKSVNSMAQAITNNDFTQIDITSFSTQKPSKTFTENDFVIIGMPVYSGRCPTIAMERLSSIKGNNTHCIIVVTYGNRDYDDALLELSDWAKNNGFIINGASALIGKHTFGEIQVTRPDEEDILSNMEFSKKAIVNTNNNLNIKGNRPYKAGGGGAAFRPSTNDLCVSCGLCVSKCPANAISKDCKTINDNCISCFRCINICPQTAKIMNSEEYSQFATAFTQRLSKRLENEYIL